MGSLFQRDGRWGIDYRDHKRRRVRKMVAAEKAVAQKALSDAIQAIEKMKVGMVSADPREAKKPFDDHLTSYLDDLKRLGRDPMYIYIIQKRIEAAAFDQDWTCLGDVTAKTISAYLRGLADEDKSPRTVNQHRADLSGFLGWCVRQRALEVNPCEQVEKSAVKKEKKRRALSVEECRWLLDAAPFDRRGVYQFMLYTGLRRSEAAALRWGHIHLDSVNPYVELPATITKSGKPESVFLVPEVARTLRSAFGNPREPVFAEIPSMELFRKDLAKAGIAEEDERGRKVVLHSLRHSLATMLAKGGVAPATAMGIMRHRDIRLTLEAYTDEGLLPAAAAMAALPSLTALPASGSAQVDRRHA